MPESPTVEAPEVTGGMTAEVRTEESTVDIDSIMSTLETIGAKTSQDVENMHIASQQSGNMANLLGEARKELADLRTIIEKKDAAPAVTYDDYGQPVQAVVAPQDIGAEVKKAIQEEKALELQAQQNYNAKLQRDMLKIEGDKFYSIVKEDWIKAQSDVKLQMRVQSGEISPYDAFIEIKDAKVLQTMQTLGNSYKDIQERGKINPPHMESGNGSPPPAENYNNQNEAFQKVKDNSSGGDSDFIAAMKVINTAQVQSN